MLLIICMLPVANAASSVKETLRQEAVVSTVTSVGVRTHPVVSTVTSVGVRTHPVVSSLDEMNDMDWLDADPSSDEVQPINLEKPEQIDQKTWDFLSNMCLGYRKGRCITFHIKLYKTLPKYRQFINWLVLHGYKVLQKTGVTIPIEYVSAKFIQFLVEKLGAKIVNKILPYIDIRMEFILFVTRMTSLPHAITKGTWYDAASSSMHLLCASSTLALKISLIEGGSAWDWVIGSTMTYSCGTAMALDIYDFFMDVYDFFMDDVIQDDTQTQFEDRA
jgi:hypothetical protein